MMDFENFQKEALAENGVQNDMDSVWVVVEGEQYTVGIDEVLDHEEQEPFEASFTLEGDLAHKAWEDLYDQYCEDNRDN